MKYSFFLFTVLFFISNVQAQVDPPSVKVGTQTWTVKNLNVDHYRNGDPISEVKDTAAWSKLTTGAWCYNDNDPGNGKIYGKLYNWYAVNDPRSLAPKGWHIPSDSEWATLSTTLGGNIESTNSNGFSLLPGGFRALYGKFVQVGEKGYWWSATECYTSKAWIRIFTFDNGNIDLLFYIKECGLSVRCVKD